MISVELRARQIRAIIARFERGADETASPYFRGLLRSAAAQLTACLARLEAVEPLDELPGRAA